MTPSILTTRQMWILKTMRDNANTDDGELVYECGVGYLGLERIAPRTVFALLRLCVISADSFNSGGVEKYHINDTGKKLLRESTI